MEIKVNDYVRCKDGIIAKIIKIIEEGYGDRGNLLYELDKETFDDTEGFEENSVYALPDQFVKHSKNIIDLIEVGDYVNGRIVEDIVKTDKKHILYCNGDYVAGGIQKNEIKSVLTKEQFSSLEYII